MKLKQEKSSPSKTLSNRKAYLKKQAQLRADARKRRRSVYITVETNGTLEERIAAREYLRSLDPETNMTPILLQIVRALVLLNR